MLKRLRIELDRFGNMRRSSGKPLAHSLNSDPKGRKDKSSSIEDAASPYRAADVSVYDRNDYVSEIDIAWPIHTGSIAISEM
jgi:hypothetical protein